MVSHLSAQTIVHQENFSSGLGTWTSVDVSDATDVWGNVSGAASINGFGGSNDEDWLISPAINMDLYDEEYLLFDYNDAYGGALLEIYYSTNYNGAGTPASVGAASWIALSNELIDINASACFSSLFQRHPAIDLSGISGSSVYFAFKYLGTAASSKQYKLDNIRILSDYYQNIPDYINCCDLKTALHQLIRNQTDRIAYTASSYDIWDALLHTDNRLNDAGTATIVWDMFTDIPSGIGEFEFDHCADRDAGSCPGGEGNCYNREHSFPKSWWGGGTLVSDTIYYDMHHVVPSDRSLNASKNNYPPGVVVTPTTVGSNGFKVGSNSSYPCSSMNYFEPIDEYKGDYARMYFFLATRYQSKIGGWESLNARGDCSLSGDPCTVFEPWQLDVLLAWHEADPVSSKEIDRNNAVYAIQGNRNPFIDRPNWVQNIWGTASGTPCTSVPLPVTLIDFHAQLHEGNAVELLWQTESEKENALFLLERSEDGIHWDLITEVEGNRTTSEQTNYTAYDFPGMTGYIYYRLSQQDLDGEVQHLKTVGLRLKGQEIQFGPNPVEDDLSIYFEKRTPRKLRILTMQGELLFEQESFEKEATLHFSSFAAGAYLFVVEDRFGQHTYRVLKR